MRPAILSVALALLPACSGNGSTALASGAGAASSGTGGAGASGSGTGNAGSGTTGSGTTGSSGASTSGQGGASGAGGGTSGSGGTCTYPPVHNPPGCPASYAPSYEAQPCSMLGLQCWYPGAGDVGPDGCAVAAMLECTNQFDDGGAPEWVAAM